MNNYFSHDSNARSDEKLVALRIKHGWLGYGLYWALIEKLRDATCYKLKIDYNLLSYDLRTDTSVIKSIINDFGLFAFENNECFYSESLLRRMDVKDSKSEKARESANKRWAKHTTQSERNTNAMQAQCERNANIRKVKESKGNIPPISPGDDHTNSIEELKLQTFNGEITWYENIAMKHHLNPGEITNWLNSFFDELVMTGETNKSLKDFKSHFYRWLKIQLEKQRKEVKNAKATDEHVY